MATEPNSQIDETNPDPTETAVQVDQGDTDITDFAAAQADEAAKQPSPKEMDRFECLACGYTYEPTKGDDRNDIPAGVPFADIPLNWRCPVCGAQKKRFANVGPAGTPSGFKENLNYGFGVNVLTPGQKSILIFGALALGFFFFLSLYGLR